MKKYGKVLWFITLCLVVLQHINIKVPRALTGDSNIILLMDNSGSMRYTDPNRLSIAAASMLIDSIEVGTRLNVIGFGDKIVSPYQLSEAPSVEALKSSLSGIKFNHNYTDMKEGLKEALSQLEKVQGDKTIILLSDGKEEPRGGITEKHRAEFNSMIEKAWSSKVKIHTIGLSRFSDAETLGRIAFRTGGSYFYCDNPTELFDIFGRILGDKNNFYTVENYMTSAKREKELKLSRYITEVIIKVASSENKIPLVAVKAGGRELFPDKIGETYKIYKFENSGDTPIRIIGGDAGKNLVMVQLKSSCQIDLKSLAHNLRIPKGVPVGIEATIDLDQSIKGLHMIMLEGDKRENMTKLGNSFRINFQKDTSGQYPVFITAYDGEGSLVAVKNADITVIDAPPFYYVEPPPQQVIAGRPFKIELKPLDSTEVTSVSAELIVDYGDSYEQFILKENNGIIAGEVSLKKTGEAKITTSVSGVASNESFSYYLPNFKTVVSESPYVVIEGDKTELILREKGMAKLTLNIKESLIYQKELISVLDSKDKKLGEFEINPDTKDSIAVNLNISERGEYPLLTLRPQGDIRIKDKVHANIKVVSSFQYYFRYVRLLLIALMVVACIAFIITLVGKLQYRKHIKPYRVSKDIYYSINSNYVEKIVSIELTNADNEIYLNVQGSIIISDRNEDYSLGKFILHRPRGNKTLQGIDYILKKGKVFSIEYIPLVEQEIYKAGEAVNGRIKYETDVEIVVRSHKKIIKLSFS